MRSVLLGSALACAPLCFAGANDASPQTKASARLHRWAGTWVAPNSDPQIRIAVRTAARTLRISGEFRHSHGDGSVTVFVSDEISEQDVVPRRDRVTVSFGRDVTHVLRRGGRPDETHPPAQLCTVDLVLRGRVLIGTNERCPHSKERMPSFAYAYSRDHVRE
jgi:hypothetical protein